MISSSVKDTHKIAADFVKNNRKKPGLIFLTGDLGAGKTEWTRGFIHAFLGKSLSVTSPSYSLINIYTKGKRSVFHLDLFRIRSLDDLESIGFWELDPVKNFILIEWPDLLLNQKFSAPVYKIHFDFKDSIGRVITEV